MMMICDDNDYDDDLGWQWPNPKQTESFTDLEVKQIWMGEDMPADNAERH